MKEWIRKIIACIVIFAMIFVIIYNILDIPDDYVVPEGSVVVHPINKTYAVTSLTVIVNAVILEVIQIFSYINKTRSPETNRENLIKLVVVTLILVGLSIYAYFVFKYSSVPIIREI